MATSGQHIRTLVVAADGVVSSKPCQWYGIDVNAAGAVILYDNASAASGTKIWEGAGPCTVMIGGGDSRNCINGIYADITGNIATVFFN